MSWPAIKDYFQSLARIRKGALAVRACARWWHLSVLVTLLASYSFLCLWSDLSPGGGVSGIVAGGLVLGGVVKGGMVAIGKMRLASSQSKSAQRKHCRTYKLSRKSRLHLWSTAPLVSCLCLVKCLYPFQSTPYPTSTRGNLCTSRWWILGRLQSNESYTSAANVLQMRVPRCMETCDKRCGQFGSTFIRIVATTTLTASTSGEEYILIPF